MSRATIQEWEKAFRLTTTTSAVNVLPPHGRRFLQRSCRVDAAVLRRFTALARYAAARVVEMVK
jgi:hypothetical protein